MRKDLPTLLLLDTQPARQVALTDRLSNDFKLCPLPPKADVLRHVRATKPAMVLLVVHPGFPERTFRLARSLKTELTAVGRLAVVNIEGPDRAVEQARDEDLVDAYYEGPNDLDSIVAFAKAVSVGEDRFEIHERNQTMRILRRFVARWRT